MRAIFLTIAGLLTLASAPAAATSALLPAAAPAPTESAAAGEPQIATASDREADQQIAARLSGIFSELPRLARVTVRVREGVVTLGGSVTDPADEDRAVAIAGRVSGVATVENAISRDLAGDGPLPGIDRLATKAAEIRLFLPLLGMAAVVALAIGLLGYLLASLGGLWRRVTPNVFLAELIASAIRFVFVVGGLVIAFDLIGAGALMGAVLGGAGVIGIALGFAMRDTIENYVSSLMLSLRQPFRANDHVIIDAHEGRVIRLTSRATILMTLDGNHLRIPNAAVFKAVILNYTRNPQRRFDFELGIDADDDPTAARHLGVEVLKRLDFVLDEPEPQARVEQVGDSNVVLRFLGWIDQGRTDWFKARSRAIPAVKAALEDAGFAIPEPIYRLRFDAGATLPVPSQTGPAARPARTAKPKTKAPAAPERGPVDTAPENSVSEMVDEERAATTGEEDLLDSSRPVE